LFKEVHLKIREIRGEINCERIIYTFVYKKRIKKAPRIRGFFKEVYAKLYLKSAAAKPILPLPAKSDKGK
jgi:hypothetical protein